MTNKLTQKQRIINLLKERGTSGVYVYELMTPRPEGLGIAQYNTRIKELREAGYNIVNVKPGHFVLEDNLTFEEIKSIFIKEPIKTEQLGFV